MALQLATLSPKEGAGRLPRAQLHAWLAASRDFAGGAAVAALAAEGDALGALTAGVARGHDPRSAL